MRRLSIESLSVAFVFNLYLFYLYLIFICCILLAVYLMQTIFKIHALYSLNHFNVIAVDYTPRLLTLLQKLERKKKGLKMQRVIGIRCMMHCCNDYILLLASEK